MVSSDNTIHDESDDVQKDSEDHDSEEWAGDAALEETTAFMVGSLVMVYELFLHPTWSLSRNLARSLLAAKGESRSQKVAEDAGKEEALSSGGGDNDRQADSNDRQSRSSKEETAAAAEKGPSNKSVNRNSTSQSSKEKATLPTTDSRLNCNLIIAVFATLKGIIIGRGSPNHFWKRIADVVSKDANVATLVYFFQCVLVYVLWACSWFLLLIHQGVCKLAARVLGEDSPVVGCVSSLCGMLTPLMNEAKAGDLLSDSADSEGEKGGSVNDSEGGEKVDKSEREITSTSESSSGNAGGGGHASESFFAFLSRIRNTIEELSAKLEPSLLHPKLRNVRLPLFQKGSACSDYYAVDVYVPPDDNHTREVGKDQGTESLKPRASAIEHGEDVSRSEVSRKFVENVYPYRHS